MQGHQLNGYWWHLPIGVVWAPRSWFGGIYILVAILDRIQSLVVKKNILYTRICILLCNVVPLIMQPTGSRGVGGVLYGIGNHVIMPVRFIPCLSC